MNGTVFVNACHLFLLVDTSINVYPDVIAKWRIAKLSRWHLLNNVGFFCSMWVVVSRVWYLWQRSSGSADKDVFVCATYYAFVWVCDHIGMYEGADDKHTTGIPLAEAMASFKTNLFTLLIIICVSFPFEHIALNSIKIKQEVKTVGFTVCLPVFPVFHSQAFGFSSSFSHATTFCGCLATTFTSRIWVCVDTCSLFAFSNSNAKMTLLYFRSGESCSHWLFTYDPRKKTWS